MRPTAAKPRHAPRPAIALSNRQRAVHLETRRLRPIVTELLRHLGVSSGELSLVFLDAPAMSRINETFLHHAGSTDVITFDYRPGSAGATGPASPGTARDFSSERPPPPGPLLRRRRGSTVGRLGGSRGDCARAGLGDFLQGELLICVDAAIEQGRRFRVPWQAELVRYIVHGLLHLQGFDDRRPALRRQMKRQEDRLLRRLAGRFDLQKLLGS